MIPSLLSLTRYAAYTRAGELFFYFAAYSVLGWVLEGIYNRFTAGTFRKDGLLKGPYKPMYGLAPVILLAMGGFSMPMPVLLAAALIVPTAVEYLSGAMLQSLFHRRWWDYSGLPYQLGGHICLKFSLYWLGLSVFVLAVIQPFMERLYPFTAGLWGLLLPLAALGLLADLLVTFRERRRAAVLPELWRAP